MSAHETPADVIRDAERSAFPFVSHGAIVEHQYFDAGMTLRDYFATHASEEELS